MSDRKSRPSKNPSDWLEQVLPCGKFVMHGYIEISPQRCEHLRRQILLASHWRDIGDHGIEGLIVGCGDGAALGCGTSRKRPATAKTRARKRCWKC